MPHLDSFSPKDAKMCDILIPFRGKMERCAASLFLFEKRDQDEPHLCIFRCFFLFYVFFADLLVF